MALLASGDIDLVETDHAPHSFIAKDTAEQENPMHIYDEGYKTCFGVPGVDFALPLLFYQARRGKITMERLVEAISTKPADIIGIKLSPDTDVSWRMEQFRIDNESRQIESGSSWTPYLGMLAVGKMEGLRIAGKTIAVGLSVKQRHAGVITDRGAII